MGGFNLIQRSCFEKLGGMQSLRMEVVEDLYLAYMVKRTGHAQRVAIAPGMMHIHWIPGPLGFVRLVEKNGFAIFRYKTWLTVLVCFGLMIHVVLPIVSIAWGGWLTVAGLATYMGILMCYFASRGWTRVSPWAVFGFAPAVALTCFAILRSMILARMRGGILWRGTLYRLDELRRYANQLVRRVPPPFA